MADREEMLQQHRDIALNDPIMVAAFRGWNDAGEAASFAAQHLAEVWNGEPIASIDPEEFYDFQSVRPTVELVEGLTRKITWPSNSFIAARLPGAAHDVLFLIGTEPSVRWKTFCSLVIDMVRKHDVRFVVTLGALLADVPHSKPVPITGTAVSEDLIARLGLQRSRYEGPTGIVGVLHESLAEAGVESASLWAAVPHYLAVTPNPKAALALVERTVELVGNSADVSELQHASNTYEERVEQMVAGDDDVQAYVKMLEDRIEDRTDEEEPIDVRDLPSGDALAAELERFLRERDPEAD